MTLKIINIFAIVFWLIGIITWFQMYQEFNDVYVRKEIHLPLIMTVAAAMVIFSARFDEKIKGLGVYVKILGIFVLLITTYLARSILGTNGI